MKNVYPDPALLIQRIAWVNEAAAGTVCGDLCMQLTNCDREEGVYTFRCQTTPNMRNVIHTLHGGSAAVVADQAMGCVANTMFTEDGHAPTAQLSLNFHRPMIAGEPLIVLVRILNASRRLIHLSAEIYAEKAPEKLCVSANSVFFRTGKE